MKSNQTGKTRKYQRLWYIWLTWALLIVALVIKNIRETNLNSLVIIAIIAASSLLLIRIIYILNRKNAMQLFTKQKKKNEDTQPLPPVAPSTLGEEKTPSAPQSLPERMNSSKPVQASKDTFISQGTQLTGTVESQGSIIVEGKIEGNLTCSHQVRIEPTGQVNGEVRAQHIMINGSIEGRCYADSLTIQAQGHMRGDIFSDKFSIEKGGVFVGQSQLMQQAQGKNKISPLKAARHSLEDVSLQPDATQQIK